MKKLLHVSGEGASLQAQLSERVHLETDLDPKWWGNLTRILWKERDFSVEDLYFWLIFWLRAIQDPSLLDLGLRLAQARIPAALKRGAFFFRFKHYRAAVEGTAPARELYLRLVELVEIIAGDPGDAEFVQAFAQHYQEQDAAYRAQAGQSA